MHIVIMGCGRVGAALAHNLQARGHSTAVIDSNPESFRRLGPDFGGRMVTGIGFDRAVLEEAGIERADGFAAVSSGDNSNIISARVAREQFGVCNVVARIYDPGRASVYERLGVPTVATVPWAADQMLRRLLPPEKEAAWRDPSGQVGIHNLAVAAAWVGQTIDQLESQLPVRVAFLTRLGNAQVSSRDVVLQDGDRLTIAMHDDDIDRVMGEHETQEQ